MGDLADGESCEMKGSAAKPYVIKNTGGVYSCSCPAWRNQSVAIESRTCKHIRKLRGDEAERERVGAALPAKKASANKDAPPLLLAQAWDNATDLSDWWISEKLDGVRAYWTGKHFLSRQGNQYHAPDWFTAELPDVTLDGELWIDRGMFQRTVSVVRRQDQSDHWKDVRYVVFDAPAQQDPFEQRMAFLSDVIASANTEFASVLDQQRCDGESHLRQKLAEIESLGGEGLMLREPASGYEVGRSSTLLKVKTFHDAEAVVLDHTAGRGKHKGRLGALVVQLPDGTEFNVGTGFSDAQRNDPPEIGSTITFRYQELSDAGVPRFPSYVRRADTVKKKKTATKAAKKKTATVKSKAAKESAAVESLPGAAYYELSDDKSSKFWEIVLDGCDVTVRYGRIGTNGQAKTKSFDDEDEAEEQYDKLVEQKTGKGYEAIRGATKKAAVKKTQPKAAAKKASSARQATKKTAKKVVKKTPAKPVAGAEYYELSDGKSNKFWEISMDGCDVTVRYGRIGTNGQTKTKSFDDDDAAQQHYDKLVEQKMGKGYEAAELGE